MPTATFTLALAAAAQLPASVAWATADGTALAGTDYTAASGTVAFAAGQQTQTLALALAPIAAGAPAKALSVTFSAPSGLALPGGTSLSVPCPIPAGPALVSYLTATGSVLRDANGVAFVPRSLNWFGFENVLVPLGLDQRAYRTIGPNEGILDQIKRLGANSIRLQVCQDVTWSANGSPADWTPGNGRQPTNSYISPELNPDFFTSAATPANQYSLPQPVISSLEMLDKIVAYAGRIGLRVILDMHCLSPSASDQTGNSRTVGGQLDTSTGANGQPNWINTKLWYTTVNPGDQGQTAGANLEYRSEAQAIAAWVALARRYAGQPAMAGCDLINEPAGGTWDDDAKTGLPAFYERVGRAIQAVNPDVLIVCEGASAGNFDAGPCVGATPPDGANELIFGGIFSANLQGVATRPVVLPVAGKVVYSPHEYGSYNGGETLGYLNAAQRAAWGNPAAKGFGHQWFYDPTYPANLAHVWSKQWGYIAEQGIAPLWIGEIGADLTVETAIGYSAANVAADQAWLHVFDSYARARSIGFAWFSINPDQAGGPLGLLQADGPNGAWALQANAWQMASLSPMFAA